MKTFLSLFNYKLPFQFVYMLQQVEYDPRKFLDWCESLFKENKKISSVIQRKSLILTTKARALLILGYGVGLATVIVGMFFSLSEIVWLTPLSISLTIAALPFTIILTLATVSLVAHVLFVRPRQHNLIRKSKDIFAKHKAVKIAVIGSYGKTTMKELIQTILKEGKKTAATPGNMNTSFSQARFATKLSGKEEVIIVEFGEGRPGDVATMTQTVMPDYAVITGLAPNHLDQYPSLGSVADDLLSVTKYMDNDGIYATKESAMLQKHLGKSINTYSSNLVMGWKISDVLISVTQTTFTMKKGSKSLHIKTGLLGRHQVAPVAFGAALADRLGLSKKQIESGCAHIEPFEHRMQPRNVHGAWLLDDTYNGNLEGLQAGLKLLSELDFERRWYVTPGLVDQGSETERVHKELGKAIAEAGPDIVVLMDNSVRPVIEKSMKKHKYSGEIRIEKNPLDFYLNIEHVIAAGDLVLLQNDWTDNYS